MKYTIKKSEINTFNRVGIDYLTLLNDTQSTEAVNRFTGESVTTSRLIAELVKWVYATPNDEVYMACID